MSEYIVSARKYRPASFESLIGQDNIARTLKNSILRGQLAHAYLFCGPRGVGKTSAARIFAKTINCSNPGPDMEPCLECESCRSFAEGRSYCIHELDAASNNGIDDMKALIDQVQIPPQVGRYSVFIIDEVHMLSTSAFNAFLKTLEEPPAHAIFILATTEKHKIIPTILSRCQTYDFNRIGVEDIVRNLRNIAAQESIRIDDESLHVIAHKADGAMRDALTIFDQTVAFCGQDVKYEDVIRNLNVLDYEYGFKLVDAFLSKDYATALLTFDQILSKGFNDLHFISAIASHLRDLLVSRTGGMESLLDLPDSLRIRYRQQAEKCSVKFIFDALGVISQCESGYRSATNQRLHIEYALMKLCFLEGVGEVRAAASPSKPAEIVPPAPQPVKAAQESPQPMKETPENKPQEGPQPVKAAVGKVPQEDAQPVKAAQENKPQENNRPAAPKPAAPVELLEIESTVPQMTDSLPVRSEPVSPRKARKTASGLSLSSLLNAEDEDMVMPAESAGPSSEPQTLPGLEVISEKWKSLCEMYSAQPRLASTLSGARLELVPGDGYETVNFFVTNESQKKWIEERILHDLEGRFQKLLSCGKVRLSPTVTPEEEIEQRVYMPSEKAKAIMDNNENIKNLVIDLGLDIR